MKIVRTKGKKHELGWLVVEVSPKEAAALIESLAAQLKTGNPNAGRLETVIEDGRFTVMVNPEIN